MKAAVFHGVGQPMSLEDVQIEKPQRREVLIRTRVAGLCHSDLHFIEGKYPHPVPAILGHEAAGVVEAVGEDVTHVKPGDHVVTCLSVFCGHCEYCTTGRQVLCSNTAVKMPPGVARRLRTASGEHLNQFLNLSAFAEQMLVHENAVVKVREDMPMDLAALLGCGVLTGYGCVAHSAKVEPGSTVAVIGCGGVGLSTVSAARLAGAGRILAIDKDPSKLDMAKLFGATDGVLADAQTVEKVLELTQGGVHHAIECVGLKQTTEDAFRMLRPGGTATIVGMIPVGVKIELHGFDFLRERRIQGSMMGSNHFRIDIPRLIDFHMQGRLQLEQLISARLQLSQINEGFQALQRGGIARNVIEFSA